MLGGLVHWASLNPKTRERGADHQHSGHKGSRGEELGPVPQFYGTPSPPVPGALGPSLPVEGGTAHGVDGPAMRREGQLCRGPQGHRARHPGEGGLFRCQGTLEWEAAFRAQNKKPGVKAREGHRRGTHLGLSPGRLWRNERRAEPRDLVTQCPKGARSLKQALWPKEVRRQVLRW